MEESPNDNPVIHGPEDVSNFFMPKLLHETKEHFMIALLNTKNRIIAAPTISIGSLSASVVHPREIFKEAIKYPCAGIILVHNHPSGDPKPSREETFGNPMCIGLYGIRNGCFCCGEHGKRTG